MLMGFASNEVAGACVSDIIRAGVLPVAIEFMDRPCIRACEAFAHAGYPDVEALLIVEVEGAEAEIAEQLGKITEIARRHGPEVIRESGSAEESALIWKGRKAAFGAMGQIADYICLDGTIPVSELPLRAAADRRADRELRARRRQRLPRRRRQHASPDPLRRQQARRPREGRGARRRHPQALRRGRRLPDRRARRRGREARPDGDPVRRPPTSRRSCGSRTSSTRAGCSTRPRSSRSRRAKAGGTRRDRRAGVSRPWVRRGGSARSRPRRRGTAPGSRSPWPGGGRGG